MIMVGGDFDIFLTVICGMINTGATVHRYAENCVRGYAPNVSRVCRAIKQHVRAVLDNAPNFCLVVLNNRSSSQKIRRDPMTVEAAALRIAAIKIVNIST